MVVSLGQFWITLALAGLAVTGCARESGSNLANPHTHCRAEGYAEGSEAFSSCVDDYIASLCTAEGHRPGEPAFDHCDRQLRDATFLRQQLDVYGR